ncbi:MAG: monovalent cation/H(+) antiporter subunit G [Hyphomicrobiales bacterium]
MDALVDLLSWALLGAGSFFLVIGAIGLVRMPDIFTRMHATSVAETLGVGFILGGLMVQGGFTLVTFKLVCLFILLFLTAPVASHAIARAAIADGVEPILDGPEIDARDGDDLPPLGSTRKVTTAIDASDAEASASVIVEDETVNTGEKR